MKGKSAGRGTRVPLRCDFEHDRNSKRHGVMERGWTRRGAEDAKQCRRCGPVAQPILLAYFRHVLTYIGNVVPATSFFVPSLSFPLSRSTAPPHPSPPLPSPRSPRDWPPPLIIVRWLSIFEQRNSRFYFIAQLLPCIYNFFERVSFFGKL